MTTQLLAGLVLLGTVLARPQGNGDFQASAVTRTGHLQFDAAIATVFPLFTPQGERQWAKGWDPEVLYPRDRDVAEGMVFRTRDHGGIVHTWTITRYDEANHLVAYNIVAPDLLVRRIEVRCLAEGANRTEVMVTDSYVGLSAKGNEFVDQLTEANYAAKMAQWKESIGGHLAAVAKSAR
ncbi:MAG: SRPBCC family protein [Acidobacteriia bacterium]|nr:SRPBCC family protein [Terriglobia bacterium]